jgi:ABC-2 type transport system permease protein
MKKSLALIRTSLLETLTYRGPMFIWISGNLLTTGVMAAVWLSADGNNLIGGLTKPQIITYYILSLFLQWVVNWLPFYSIVEEIQSGGILKWLIRPVSYYWVRFMSEIGWHLFSIFFGLIGALVLYLFLGSYFQIDINLSRSLLVIISTLFALLLVFTSSLALGLTAFWLTEVSVFDTLFWTGRMFLGGQSFPLSFFPAGIRPFINLLPFRYMFSFPLEIIFNQLNTSQLIAGFAFQIFWLIILTRLYKLFWGKGRRIYGAFGH